MKKEAFIHRVQFLAGIMEHDRAEKATGAVLSTLCGRITSHEARDLEAQLPEGIDAMCRGTLLRELVSRVSGPSRLDREQFVDRVAEQAGLDRLRAEQVTTAVFRTLKEQISAGEAGDVADQLPRKLKIMWLES